MADPRTFVLIGDFQDNITPALDGINNSIARLKQTMSTMTSKRGGGFSDVTQSVGKLISSQKHLANSIKEVGDAAKVATGELKSYKNMVGKVASAHYHIAKAANQAGDKIASSNNKAIASIDRLDRREKLYASARRQRLRNLSSVGAASYSPTRRTTARPAAAPRMAGGGGGGGGGRGVGYGGSFDMPAFAFGMTLGQGISQPITAAVLSGFQLGVGLLQQSFQYISSSFAERVQDQMTDLQAAGGYFSIAKRQKNPMFTTLQQSVMFTQRTNDVLERLAGDLPGSTEDYVKVSKRIGDSVMRLVDSNEKGAIDYAKELMAKGQLQESYRGVSLEGPQARESAVQVILGELTKKTVLAGFGGTTGRGGAAGAYGLPALMERLITNPDTSMAQLQKYAAVFGDPKIMSALDRAMPELEKAGSDMLARTKVINNMLDEVSPPEMIAAMRKSMAGVLEAYRSAFFSPGTGLFGFGRKLKDASGKLQPLTDVYGRFIRTVEENGKKVEQVVKTAEEADQVDLDVFNMFSDIISNYAAILKPIVDNLHLIWDPLQGIANALRQARIVSIEVLQTFRNYVAGLEKFAEGITDKGLKNSFLSTKSLRATLLTITNLFTELGVLSEADFSKFRNMIIDPKATIDDLGGVLKSLADTFFNSEAATEVGKFFGNILREVVIVLADITDFGKMLGKSNLASGFAEGFGEKGFKALERMFTNIYDMIFSAIGKAISAIPPSILLKIAGYALAGSLVVAGIAGLGMAIGAGVAKLLGMLAASVGQKIASGSMLANCLSNLTGLTCGAAGGGAGRGTQRNSQLRNRRDRMNFLLGAGGEERATRRGLSLKERLRSARQTSYAGPIGPLPAHSFYKGERTAYMRPGRTLMGGAQGDANSMSRLAKKLGKAPMIAPALQAMSGMFQGGGGRSLIRQRNMMGGAARGMAKMGRFVPGGALLFGGIDAAMRVGSGQGAGRAVGGAASSMAGAAAGGKLGAAIGTAFTPGVGTLIGGVIGSVAGGIMGDKLFNTLMPETQKQVFAAQTQMAAASRQMEAANQKGAERTGVDIGAAQSFVEDPMKLYQAATLMGEQNNPTVRALQDAATSLKVVAPKVTEQEKKYNDLINYFIKPADQGGLGYSRQQANLQPEVIAAKKELTRLKESETALRKNVSELFNKLPPKLTESLVKTVGKVSDAALTAAFVAKINNIKVPQVKYNWKDVSPDQPPDPNVASDLFRFPPKPPETKQEGLNLSRYTRSSRKNWGEGCSISGSLGNGSVSSVDSFNSVARSAGLSLTSGYRPGSKGWHGVDRARDYSNGYAPTPQMMEFAQTLASQYGGKLKELIYTPLGYSIKDGRKVAPIAAGSHYNHVHVAYANGIGNPVVAPTEKLAQKIDAQALGKANVKTYTAGKGEFGGSNTFGDINVTVNAAGMSDPREIAYAVAIELGNAVQTKLDANLGFFG